VRPTQVLSNEHRVIEVVLDCLDELAARTRSSNKLDKAAAAQFIDFIKTFADGCHHGKEEKHLFVALEGKGASRESGPVGVMLHEHELGRGFVRQMVSNIDRASDGDKAALLKFIEAAEGYVGLLRAHIMKEDQILFPLADQLLSNREFEKMTEEFEHVESHHMGEGTHQKYLDLARALADEYGVKAEALNGTGSCACGHAK
jgi:hemerythrin-like domain-containing protein